MKYQICKDGYYGKFGGTYIPEMLFANVQKIAESYLRISEEEIKK